jgi:hypothetical protein
MAFMLLLHVRGCLFIASFIFVSMICTGKDLFIFVPIICTGKDIIVTTLYQSRGDTSGQLILLVKFAFSMLKMKNMLSTGIREAPRLYLHDFPTSVKTSGLQEVYLGLALLQGTPKVSVRERSHQMSASIHHQHTATPLGGQLPKYLQELWNFRRQLRTSLHFSKDSTHLEL